MTYMHLCQKHATCGHYSDVDVYFSTGSSVTLNGEARDGSSLSLCADCSDAYWNDPTAIQFVPQHGGDCNQLTAAHRRSTLFS